MHHFIASGHWRKRTLAIARMRDEGKTLAEIGKAFGLTRDRVRQLLVEETERRDRPFEYALQSRRCAGCGRKIAKQNKSGFCFKCKPRRPTDWATRTVERGIYRHYSRSAGEYTGPFRVHDFRAGPEIVIRTFERIEQARAFRAAQAAERPFRAQPSPTQDHVLDLLASGPVTLKKLAQHLGGTRQDYDRTRAALQALGRKGLVERVSPGVYRRTR
jgi:hypothetical protein